MYVQHVHVYVLFVDDRHVLLHCHPVCVCHRVRRRLASHPLPQLQAHSVTPWQHIQESVFPDLW